MSYFNLHPDATILIPDGARRVPVEKLLVQPGETNGFNVVIGGHHYSIFKGIGQVCIVQCTAPLCGKYSLMRPCDFRKRSHCHCMTNRKGTIAHNGEKRCSSCQEIRTVDWFVKNKRCRDGLHNSCCVCDWEKRLRQYYGLLSNRYYQMIDSGNDCCWCCRRTRNECNLLTEPFNSWFIDHCHITFMIRGLLCRACNTALGAFGDTLASVKRFHWLVGVKYLEDAEQRFLTGNVDIIPEKCRARLLQKNGDNYEPDKHAA